ncbi:MAG: HU family DNA-binding protein [Proteobacteria bacterium]|nr:HU family DNA-binding protein [Pseudomonadota bacterium]
MARNEKPATSPKTTKARATPAGPKSRSKTKAVDSGDVALSVSDAATPRAAHLRAVTAAETGEAPAAQPVEGTGAGAADTRFKRQALLEAVCARTPMKRGEVKTLVELVLEELGRAIDAHDELALPPLGKLSIKRRNSEGSGGDNLSIKLKRAKDAADAGDETPLAAAGEDG